MRRVLSALMVLFLSPVSVGDSSYDSEYSVAVEEHELCRLDKHVLETRQIGDYQIDISMTGQWDCVRLDIKKSGILVYHTSEIGTHFYFGSEWDEGGNPLIQITPDESPKLVISEWSGGAQCCFVLHIFELGTDFRKIASIDGGNFQPFFEDLDGDGVLELRIDDDFLAYRFSSFADTASADVVLEYIDGQYHVASKFMQTPAPDQDLLVDKARSYWEGFKERRAGEDAPRVLILLMNKLAFTGHKQMALDIADLSWPANFPGKFEFLKSYEEGLAESKYYSAFEAQILD